METFAVTKENIEEIRLLYEDFTKTAQEDFLFEMHPIPFDDFRANFEENFVKLYLCKNPVPQGFLLYSDALTQGIEITLIYTKNKENPLDIQTALIKKFIEDCKKTYKNKVISYPMLGIQNAFTQDITNLGFSPVGEAILEFNFSNPASNIILEKSQTAQISEPYTIDIWNDTYYANAARVIYEEFSKLNDAKFDPRFKTFEGSKQVLECIIKGFYGKFLPEETTVLKYKNTPVGFCFVNLTTPQIANIPLLCISDKYKHKGFGAAILKNSITAIKNSISANNLAVKSINTTCDTSNFPAMLAYRKVGFKEKTYYTHAYMEI